MSETLLFLLELNIIHPGESVHDILANSGVKKSIMGQSSVGKMDEKSTMKIEAISLTNI